MFDYSPDSTSEPLYEDYRKKLSNRGQDNDSAMQPSEKLIDLMLEMIEDNTLTAQTKAKHSVEPLQLPEKPKLLKLTETGTKDPRKTVPHQKVASTQWPTKSSSPRPSSMLGELTATTTDYKATSRDTAGNKTASNLTTKKETATMDAASRPRQSPSTGPKSQKHNDAATWHD